METYTLVKKLSCKKEYDIVVCGGGVAGCAAAITAAKHGASVLLIEKSNILGGLATLGLVNFFVPMCNGNGKQIIFGLAEKWLRDSAKYGFDTIAPEWKNGQPAQPTNARYFQMYSPYIFAIQLEQDVLAAGADILFDCNACEPVMEENICKGVITDSKSGLELYSCKILIDVTGDCDLMRRAGVPVKSGENYFSYYGRLVTLEGCKKAVETGDIKHAFTTIWGGSINLYGDNQPDDVPKWSGLTVEEVTDYLIKNRKVMFEKLKKTDRKSRDVATFPLMPQFRTTAHLDGDYTFKVTDAYKHFDDSIGAINDFDHKNHLFEVPLRSITRGDFPNIITAGRSACGEGYGWDLLRVIPPAIVTGQSAALCSVAAMREGVGVSQVNIKSLQNKIEEEGLMVHFPDEYIPDDRSVIIHGKNAVDVGHI